MLILACGKSLNAPLGPDALITNEEVPLPLMQDPDKKPLEDRLRPVGSDPE